MYQLRNNRETYWIKHYKSYIKEYGYNILIEAGHGRRGLTKLTELLIDLLLNLYFLGKTYTELGKIFNMHRKSIKSLLERINGNPIATKAPSLESKIDLKWLKSYLLECNPTAEEVMRELHISRATLFKFTKSISYKFLSYLERLRLNLEYNSSKSVQQPKLLG